MKLPNLTMPDKPSLHEYVENVTNMWKELVEDSDFMKSLSEDQQKMAKEMNKELDDEDDG